MTNVRLAGDAAGAAPARGGLALLQLHVVVYSLNTLMRGFVFLLDVSADFLLHLRKESASHSPPALFAGASEVT